MTNKNTPESTDRVVQGPDRVYRWKYTLSREQALVHYKFMKNMNADINQRSLILALSQRSLM